MKTAELCQIYRCLSDGTRLRILNLLSEGPLCVCHLQSVLDEPQVKVSKHLASLRASGLVESVRRANWMIYRIADTASSALERNLACLHDLRQQDPTFKTDLKRLQRTDTSNACC